MASHRRLDGLDVFLQIHALIHRPSKQRRTLKLESNQTTK